MISLLAALRSRKWIIGILMALAISSFGIVQQVKLSNSRGEVKWLKQELVLANGRLVMQNERIVAEAAAAAAREAAATKRVKDILSKPRTRIPTETIEEMNRWFAQPR